MENQNVLLKSFLESNTLVQRQVESFNRFLDSGLQTVVNRQGTIEPSVEGFALKLGKVRLEKASVIRATAQEGQ